MEGKTLIAVALTLLALSTSLLSAPASGQSFNLPEPSITVAETNTSITVTTPYYRVVVNKTAAEIDYIELGYPGLQGTRITPSGYPGLALLYGDNETLEAVPWTSVQLVDASEYRKLLVFETSIAGEPVRMTITLDAMLSYMPVIVDLPAPGVYYLVLPVNASIAGDWVLALSYYSGGTLQQASTREPAILSAGNGMDSVALLGVSTQDNNTALDLVAGYSSLPGYIQPLRAGAVQSLNQSIVGLPSGNDTLLLAVNYIVAGGGVVAGVNLAVAGYDPYTIVSSGLYYSVLAAYPDAINDYKAIVYFAEFTKQVNETITLLRNRITQLSEENKNLTKQLEEYQGCESYWKNEVKVRESTIERYRSMLQASGLKIVLALLAGLILGVVGGVYVFQRPQKPLVARKKRR